MAPRWRRVCKFFAAAQDEVGGGAATSPIIVRVAGGRAHIRGLAAQAPEFCCPFRPHREERAQGRPGAGWHPGSAREKRTRGDPQVMPGHPGLPCAMVLRLMARSPRGAMHYCPRRLADDRCAHPVGPHITASLDAQTPGVRTTRFCRPRTSLPGHPEARACSPPKPKRNAVTVPGRSRRARWLTGVARPATSSRAGAAASIAFRLTYRDDRETPFWRAGMSCGLPEEMNSVNQNIWERHP
ncbi:hypothetical protein ABIB06_007269 [Bradyrhizobium sp. LB8.2]